MPAINVTADSTIAALTECHDVHRYRTVASIVQSCLSTIFLCIWVVIHPDVPEDRLAPTFDMVLERIFYMIIGLLAPEMLCCVALLEWVDCSGFFKKLIREYPACGWTETHAFFAYMGGFRLVNADGSTTRLEGQDFFTRVFRDEIDIPTVTLESIHDKSRGDWITKAIVVVQTLWFALQVMNRYVQYLNVTELEITTLAYLTLNVFIYWCWWNKPLNVMLPIDIPAKSSASDITQLAARQSGERSAYRVQHIGEGEFFKKTDKERFLGDKEAHATQLQLSIRVRMGALFDSARFALALVTALVFGTFGGFYCLAWYSTFHTQVESILWQSCSSTVVILPCVIICYFTLFDIDTSSLKKKGRVMAVVGLIIEALIKGFAVLASVLYISARLCLLVLAFLALRTVPEKALLIPSWTRYIPHI